MAGRRQGTFRVPTATTVGLEIVRMHPQALAAGIGTHDVVSTPVPIFDPTKTIADLFKFRNRGGLDVALEALRAYWASDDRDPDALRHYARIDGIDKVIQPYLEAVAA